MKKQKLSAKILSLALAMCMALSLVPAAQADGVADINVNFLGKADLAAVLDYNQAEPHTADVWYYDTASTQAPGAYYPNGCLRFAPFYAGGRFIVNFYAETAGTYDLSIAADLGGAFNVSVGVYSYDVTIAAGTNTVGNVGVEAGWNRFVLTAPAKVNDLQIDGFTLTYVGEGNPVGTYDYNFTAPITTSASSWSGETSQFLEFKDYNNDNSKNTWDFVNDLGTGWGGNGANMGASGCVRFALSEDAWMVFDIYVPAKAYYKPTLNFTGAGTSGTTAEIAIDANVLGTVDTATENDVITSQELSKGIELSQGWHKLVMSRTGGGNTLKLRGIKFMPAEKPTTAAVAETKVIDFKGYAELHREGTFPNIHYKNVLAEYGWAINEEKSTPAVFNGNNTYISTNYKCGLLGFADANVEVGDVAVFDFDVSAPGYYGIDIAYQKNADVAVLVDGYYVGNLYDAEKSGIYLNGNGTHTIAFKKIESTASRAIVEKITFTPAEAPATHDVFGEKYAYVYKKDGGFAIDFLGGLKEIDGYTDVGFEISVDGAAAQDYSTRYVYKTITVNGSEMKAADDFDAEYIFAITKDDIAASAQKVTITPYIIDANGNKISHYGKTLTIDLSTLA